MVVPDRARRRGPELVPLPVQADSLPWPTVSWPIVSWATGPVPAGADLESLVDEAFDASGPLHETFAVVLVQGGRLVVERYGGCLARSDGSTEPVTESTPLRSWSMAKSMLHAVVGMLVGDGRLSLDDRAPVPDWQGTDDPRRAITLQHLLEMRDGLDFVEDYVDAAASDVIEMLFGEGRADVARFAADRPLAAVPGTRFNYSSGTSNVISGVVAGQVGRGPAYRRFLADRLFGPLGMGSATATLDEAGTWVASSYVHATARDYARFGLLYLRDGTWDGRRLLPAGWVDHGRTPRSVDPGDGLVHGAHWWVVGDDHGTFWAAGHDGQSIDVCPGLDLVLVRLGRTGSEHSPDLRRWRARIIGHCAQRLE